MDFQYDTTVINLAENMHKIVYNESDTLINSPFSNKKIRALKSAITAVARLHKKTFEEVYEDVSSYAGWLTLRDSLNDFSVEFNEKPIALAV